MSDTVALVVMALTLGVLAFLVPFAFHRMLLLLMSGRSRSEHVTQWPEVQLPHVTVQLPIYNERLVASRLIDAVCLIDYPARLLEVQVLDDSDDATRWIVDERVAYWRARGVDVVHITRDHRGDFKAGGASRGDVGGEGRISARPRCRLRRTSRPRARPSASVPRPVRGHGASPLGPPESRRDLVHGGAGASSRRTLPFRARWTVRRRPLLQLQRYRGRVAANVSGGCRRVAWRYAHRGSRLELSRPDGRLALCVPRPRCGARRDPLDGRGIGGATEALGSRRNPDRSQDPPQRCCAALIPWR